MKISAHQESWALKSAFSISRGSKTQVDVVVVKIESGSAVGMGESIPYPRYNQTVEQTLNAVQVIAEKHADHLSRDFLRHNYPPDAARNALDCALWDFEAKKNNTSVWQLAGLAPPVPVVGAYSLSLDPPEQLAKSAQAARNFPLLKVKLGKNQVIESIRAVRMACPEARIIVDANEAWDIDTFVEYIPQFVELGVEMIEQPLPADEDEALEDIDCAIAICADESFHRVSDLKRLANRYDIFNIKLDKTGGLTEAIEVARAVRSDGKKVMVGSMMATSLGLAPAMLLTVDAEYIDLDSPVWLAKDRPGGIQFENGLLQQADQTLWG